MLSAADMPSTTVMTDLLSLMASLGEDTKMLHWICAECCLTHMFKQHAADVVVIACNCANLSPATPDMVYLLLSIMIEKLHDRDVMEGMYRLGLDAVINQLCLAIEQANATRLLRVLCQYDGRNWDTEKITLMFDENFIGEILDIIERLSQVVGQEDALEEFIKLALCISSIYRRTPRNIFIIVLARRSHSASSFGHCVIHMFNRNGMNMFDYTRFANVC